MKKFFADFKKFISRGNIMDMAVGVIIGGAFSAIVTALTNKIIMPLINFLLALGGSGLDSAYTFLKIAYQTDANGEFVLDSLGNQVIDLANSIYIDWGAFITAVIDFFLIALVLFLILKAVMKSSEMFRNTTASLQKGRLTKEEKAELAERGIDKKDKAAVQAYREEKAQAAEQAKLEEEAKKKAEEEEKYRNSTEGLLKEILTTLKEENKEVKTSSRTTSAKATSTKTAKKTK